ncbi:type II toxin-antitoxin system VapC family toxin [Rhizobium sullae]|uniref:PIN domain nuclease of toxin-antitoxin system n=1 Tax=Rhizobium sullae TaxID=50338 RepID=A0A2N0D4Z1_RHISU|nr:type II toxin-antitoxin system VapC family toxin [Rhizobium sullae]PKA41176.1 type II toxin-antitoxin system VapC family toxin [Rhizobium sullae]TCU17219.1 PIN domain nuclease of toxin-antitoxin system [Rhizobium sullae]UWU12736.1 type II toxin-antitoxin system VapC family toxin [Rhizobium sullae]
MRLLLDTHIVLAILRKDVAQRFPVVTTLLGEPQTVGFVSVASLWETAIKARLGKLDPGMPLEEMAQSLQKIGLSLLGIDVSHVITAADPEPDTRDPFDRLLLAQCQIEGLRLVTIDRALADHPLALKF